MKSIFRFLCTVIAVFLVFALAGCSAPVNPKPNPDPTESEYAFTVDRETVYRYVLSGSDWIKPEDTVVSVTNTGTKPLSVTAKVTGLNSLYFSVSPASVSNLDAGMSQAFTVAILAEDPYTDIYNANLLFESGINHGKLAARVNLRYGGITLQYADITLDQLPLQTGGAAAIGTNDASYTNAMHWFTSNDAVVSIEGGIVTALTEGQVILGFVYNDDGDFIVRGKKITVYPATLPLDIEYPLVDGVVSRPAGGAANVLNLDEIKTAAGVNSVTFTKEGGGAVISAINADNGSLTFSDAASGASAAITVHCAIVRYVTDGPLTLYSGSAGFTARIGAAPAPVFVSAGTVNSEYAVQALQAEAVFSDAVSGNAGAGFTLSDGTDNLTIQSAVISGSRITFTLAAATPILYGDTITIAYDSSSGNISGNGTPLAGFTGKPVANNLNFVERGPAMVSAVMDGTERANANKVIITYDKSFTVTNLDGFSVGNATGGSFTFSAFTVNTEENTVTVTLNRLPMWQEINSAGNDRLQIVYDANAGNIQGDVGQPGIGGSVPVDIANFGNDYKPPEPVSIIVDGGAQTSLVITYDKALAAGTGRTGFALEGAEAVSFTGQTVSGAVFTLTMNRAPSVAEAAAGLTLSYNAISGNVADTAGNRLESFTARAVTITNPEMFVNPPEAESAHIDSASPAILVLAFDEPVSMSSAAGLSLSGSATATNVLSFSGNGTNGIALTLNLKPAFGETVTVAYNAGEGNIRHNANSNVTVASFSLPVSLSGFTDNDQGRPAVVSVEIDARRSGNNFSIDDAILIYVTFNKPVLAASSQGFSVTGSATAQRITAISGSGT
ncbi:MAG: hypothetical protein FWF29_08835, partial [Treponema sp.]|nr:hypothetical protein [Treponema sp.]